jgi:hypothetical protein
LQHKEFGPSEATKKRGFSEEKPLEESLERMPTSGLSSMVAAQFCCKCERRSIEVQKMQLVCVAQAVKL